MRSFHASALWCAPRVVDPRAVVRASRLSSSVRRELDLDGRRLVRVRRARGSRHALDRTRGRTRVRVCRDRAADVLRIADRGRGGGSLRSQTPARDRGCDPGSARPAALRRRVDRLGVARDRGRGRARSRRELSRSDHERGRAEPRARQAPRARAGAARCGVGLDADARRRPRRHRRGAAGHAGRVRDQRRLVRDQRAVDRGHSHADAGGIARGAAGEVEQGPVHRGPALRAQRSDREAPRAREGRRELRERDRGPPADVRCRAIRGHEHRDRPVVRGARPRRAARAADLAMDRRTRAARA